MLFTFLISKKEKRIFLLLPITKCGWGYVCGASWCKFLSSGYWFGGIADLRSLLWTGKKGILYHWRNIYWQLFVFFLYKNQCFPFQILKQNRKLMDAMVDELVQKKSLTKKEFFNLVEMYGSLDPIPPNLLDIRAAKSVQFQERMMSLRETAVGKNVWARYQENHPTGAQTLKSLYFLSCF